MSSQADLRIIKLSSGEEIIGLIESIDDNENEDRDMSHMLLIRSPMKIINQYNKDYKGYELYLAEWVPSSGQDTYPIPKHQIMTIVKPNEVVEDHYYEVVLADALEDEPILENEQELKERRLHNILKNHKFNEDDDLQ